MKQTIATVAAVMLLSGAIPALAQGPGDPPGGDGPPSSPAGCQPGEVVDNEDLRIWFQGKKGQLQVFKKNSSNDGIEGKYQYKQIEIVELDEANETVARLNLENAEPMSSDCSVERSGNWVNVTYEVTDEVRTPGEDDGPTVGQADVVFVYHFNTTDDSAKFDLNIQEWPWQSTEEHELAYGFDVTSDWVIEPAENGLGFRDNETGESEAFIEWAPNATAHYEDGHNETALVDSNTTGSDHHVTTQLRFTNVTAGYVELDYDPTVAVGPYVIVADVLVPMTDVPPVLRGPVLALAG